MIDFAKYAFNKSHAATYAVVTFQTAYLKYHYPAKYLLLSRQMNIPIKSRLHSLCKEDGTTLSEGETAVVGSMIRSVTVRTTRKKKQMACLILEDLVGSMDVIVFPEQFEKYQSFLEEGKMVFCLGKVKKEEEKDACLQMNSVSLFSTEGKSRSIWLQFFDFADYQEKESRLVSIMRKYPGKEKICFYLKKTKQIKQGQKNDLY